MSAIAMAPNTNKGFGVAPRFDQPGVRSAPTEK